MENLKNCFYSEHLKRFIRIEADDIWVEFYFVSDVPLLDDGLFYDFYKEDWESRMAFHLQQKKWFTPEMYNFISSQINKV